MTSLYDELFLGFLAQIEPVVFLYLFGGVLPVIGAVLAIAFLLVPPYSRVSVVSGTIALIANCLLVSVFFYFAVPR